MKTLLLIAFHFPPHGGGSGIHRATNFARYLPNLGWKPYILTAHPRAYEKLGDSDTGLPDDIEISRAFALDARKHLGVRGWYPKWSALPDRWAAWAVGAVPIGLNMLLRKRMDVILVTFPIATAVLIGWVLHVLSGKPLVVDFRDSMTEETYPRDRITRSVHRFIERRVIRDGSGFLFTTKTAREMYLRRYPDLAPSRCVLVPNGYDEDDFVGIVPRRSLLEPRKAEPDRRLRLVHSGLIYPDDRDPRPFFRAVKRIKEQYRITAKDLSIDLRASGAEELYSNVLRVLDIADLVHLLPGLPYLEALRDTARADGLLLFQAASCNHQIPAKLYEYLRIGKPILALTPESGDTAAVLRTVGGATTVDLADEDDITHILPIFLTALREQRHALPDRRQVEQFTREKSTMKLAECLNTLQTPAVASDMRTT